MDPIINRPPRQFFYAIVYLQHDSSLLLRSILRSHNIMVADHVLWPTSAATSARSFITSTDNGRRLLTNKNACITTTSTEPYIWWYIVGARDKAAIAEQIAAVYMAARQTV